jgi:hypothetical protein
VGELAVEFDGELVLVVVGVAVDDPALGDHAHLVPGPRQAVGPSEINGEDPRYGEVSGDDGPPDHPRSRDLPRSLTRAGDRHALVRLKGPHDSPGRLNGKAGSVLEALTAEE